MTKETYIKWTDPFRKNKKKAAILQICNRMTTTIIFGAYPLLIILLFVQKDPLLARALIVPLDAFLILTFLRWLMNAPRPYEVFAIPPVYPKNKKGESFPSRHVFSAVMIAMTYLAVFPWWEIGAVLMVFSALLAVVRILAGIHFPKDVIAGAIFALLSAYIGFWVL